MTRDVPSRLCLPGRDAPPLITGALGPDMLDPARGRESPPLRSAVAYALNQDLDGSRVRFPASVGLLSATSGALTRPHYDIRPIRRPALPGSATTDQLGGHEGAPWTTRTPSRHGAPSALRI